MITAQEIFNKVATHLIEQDEQALNSEGECVYLDKITGRRCAIGCLIPDDHSALHLQFMGGVNSLFNAFPDLEGLMGTENFQLLVDLQKLHDTKEPELWSDGLRVIADRFDLTIPECLVDE